MFDIGWMELLVIGVVALIVVGPKDLPGLFRSAGRFVGRIRSMAREFQRSMENAADEAGLKEAADTVRKAADMRDIAKDPLASATKAAQDYAKSVSDEFDEAAKAASFSDKAASGKAADASATAATAAKAAPKKAAPKKAAPKQAAKKPAAKKPATKNQAGKKTAAAKTPSKNPPKSTKSKSA